MNTPSIFADWNTSEGVATSEGLIKPLIATSNVSLSALEISPGEEVVPHKHDGLPYFEVILCIMEGNLEVIAGKEKISANPGTFIMAHPDEMGWSNKSDRIVRALIIHAPPPAWKSAGEFLDRIKSWK